MREDKRRGPLQIVWWGLTWRLRVGRPDGLMGNVYRWTFWIGPIEVRRWA